MSRLTINCNDTELYGRYKIYAFIDEGVIVYIGCTKKTIYDRCVAHCNTTGRGGVAIYINKLIEAGKALEAVNVMSFDNEAKALEFEMTLIEYTLNHLNINLLNKKRK